MQYTYLRTTGEAGPRLLSKFLCQSMLLPSPNCSLYMNKVLGASDVWQRQLAADDRSGLVTAGEQLDSYKAWSPDPACHYPLPAWPAQAAGQSAVHNSCICRHMTAVTASQWAGMVCACSRLCQLGIDWRRGARVQSCHCPQPAGLPQCQNHAQELWTQHRFNKPTCYLFEYVRVRGNN